METLEPDADQGNADWVKQGWDIPATSLKELRAYLVSRQIPVGVFKAWPVYQRNLTTLPWLKGL